jgi:hypothetical protein
VYQSTTHLPKRAHCLRLLAWQNAVQAAFSARWWLPCKMHEPTSPSTEIRLPSVVANVPVSSATRRFHALRGQTNLVEHPDGLRAVQRAQAYAPASVSVA